MHIHIQGRHANAHKEKSRNAKGLVYHCKLHLIHMVMRWFVPVISRLTQSFIWRESLSLCLKGHSHSLYVPYCGSLSSFPWNDISVTYTGQSVPFPRHKQTSSWRQEGDRDLIMHMERDKPVPLNCQAKKWCNLGLFKVIFRGHMNEVICHISKWDWWNKIQEGPKEPPTLW